MARPVPEHRRGRFLCLVPGGSGAGEPSSPAFIYARDGYAVAGALTED